MDKIIPLIVMGAVLFGACYILYIVLPQIGKDQTND